MMNSSSLLAYEVPDEYYYFDIDDRNLGSVMIYLPVTTYNFSLKNDNPVNIGTSNITGYMTLNGNEYTITFQPYQFGRYRLNNTQNYQYLDVESLVSTNVPMLNIYNKKVSDSFNLIIPVLLFLGVLGLWIPSYKH